MPNGAFIWSMENPGEWQRAELLLNKMASGRTIREIELKLPHILDEARKRIVESVENQTFTVEGLSKRYEEYKVTHGLDPRVLIATGEYLDSISVTKIADGVWALRPEGTTKHGLSMEELGSILEYGGDDMPARPHWVLQKDSVRRDVYREIQEVLQREALV